MERLPVGSVDMIIERMVRDLRTVMVAVSGAAHPHHAYVFANRRGDRLKMLVH